MLAITNYWITWFPGAVLASFGVIALAFKGFVYLVNATRTLKQTQESLPLIQAEFGRNGGESLRDRIEALHVRSIDMSSTMKTHIDADAQAFRRQERTNDRVERTLDRIEGQLRKG